MGRMNLQKPGLGARPSEALGVYHRRYDTISLGYVKHHAQHEVSSTRCADAHGDGRLSAVLAGRSKPTIPSSAMRSFSFLAGIVAALVAVGAASPVSSTNHVVHEQRSHVRREWSRIDRLHQNAVLPVRIGLTQTNLHRAEEFMNEVSHPNSPNYGKHWSADKIIETFAPTGETIESVMNWLQEEGIDASRLRLSRARTWISFEATTAEMERLLKTEYHVYDHESGSTTHVACDRYHIPAHVTKHVDIITPTIHFDQKAGTERKKQHKEIPEETQMELRKKALKRRQVDSPLSDLQLGSGIVGRPKDGVGPKQGSFVAEALMDLTQCDTMITPDCLRALYAAPPGSLAASNNTLGIVEYTPQAFLQTDLDTFFTDFKTELVAKPPIVSLLANGVVQQNDTGFEFNGESGLDLEYAMEMIFPQQVTVFQVGDLVQGASFGNFLDAIDGSYCDFDGGDSPDPNIDGQYDAAVLCGVTAPTNVISTSYGYNEGDLSGAYEQRQCNEYMKLGLAGVTFLFSSGDSGVAGNGNQCIDPTTGAYNDGAEGIFNPSFPGGCPWVTSVGATQVLEGASVRSPESACMDVIFSGGGFSNVFAMPDYQATAISDYFANFAPPYGADKFNNSQTVRAFPDVAANGANYVTVVDGNFSLSFGTSASAPVFAALVNMINEKRIEQGKSGVGFMNPVLYANQQVLIDIQTGTNPGCGTQGFSAVPGWDPVTGLGTPNYPAMEELFLGLP
ncbi:hypothetical protein MKZ38_000692 [Zalerion maritima]|uniref:tripeptidyl-peptidase II n=1 Tax=Zalerion maritima TaxID=339359 RepID=A0AAD5WN22_9PEZI|nr:hypothetical protein MKZ38_000692 [Zalerion maritima]